MIKLIINDTYMLKFSAILYIYLSFLSIFSDDFFLGKKALSGRIPEIRFKKNHQLSGRIRMAEYHYPVQP